MRLSGPGPVPGLAPSPVPGPDARHAVVDELRKAEYHRGDQSFVSQAWNWVLDRLDSLFSGSPGANTLLVLLVIVAAVVILAVVRAGVPRRTARRPSASDPLAPDADVDHRQLALAFAANGQRAEALREWLRAAVASVEERGVLLPRPGRTGAALAREAGPLLPDAAADLTAAATAFDEVWFGGRAATDADVAAARSAAELADRVPAR
jgi:hypothetical protein